MVEISELDCAYCPLGIAPGMAVMLDGFPAHQACADGVEGFDLASIRADVAFDLTNIERCSTCGSTSFVELHDTSDSGREQSILVCAECGSDEA
jgi:hypothetical protein